MFLPKIMVKLNLLLHPSRIKTWCQWLCVVTCPSNINIFPLRGEASRPCFPQWEHWVFSGIGPNWFSQWSTLRFKREFAFIVDPPATPSTSWRTCTLVLAYPIQKDAWGTSSKPTKAAWQRNLGSQTAWHGILWDSNIEHFRPQI